MIKENFKYFIWFIIIISLQILVFNNINISGYLNPFIYILFILLLPFNIPGYLLLFISFLTGLIIDTFMYTYGLHSSVTLFIGFIRPFILKIIEPREGYNSGTTPRIFYYGNGWFFKYTLIVVIIHHFFLFFLESFNFNNFFHTFLRATLSSILSTIIIFLSQLFIFRK